MSLPFVPGIAERMEELGYDQLLRAYEDKYGKKYPPYRMEVHKEGGLAYMEELRVAVFIRTHGVHILHAHCARNFPVKISTP